MKDVPPDIFRQLLDDAALGAREVAERVAKARDAAYWRQLIDGPRELSASTTASEDVEAAVAAYRRNGVYRLNGAMAASTVARLNVIVDRVVGAGWPGVFAFACDEPWACGRLHPVRTLVEGALGAGARQIPHVWTHIVKPGGEQAGWSPHVDGPGAERLTVWIALSDSGLDNGCMYAVLKDAAVEKSLGQWCEVDLLTKEKVKALLQATTAMPAAAGDVIGWAFDIVHWGGRVTGKHAGRRSLSLEFIGPHAAPAPADEPLVPLDGPLPSHTDRLRAIASALLEYRKFEPLVVRYQGVARALLDEVNTIHGS